ncbi:MAG: hypothetical protein WC242_05625 [Candidatus Paceibacterota bacterium]|jgi:hypothetical protein
MPEFSGELRSNVEVERNYTLTQLRRLLDTTPEIFRDSLEEIRQTVEDAEVELK